MLAIPQGHGAGLSNSSPCGSGSSGPARHAVPTPSDTQYAGEVAWLELVCGDAQATGEATALRGLGAHVDHDCYTNAVPRLQLHKQ